MNQTILSVLEVRNVWFIFLQRKYKKRLGAGRLYENGISVCHHMHIFASINSIDDRPLYKNRIILYPSQLLCFTFRKQCVIINPCLTKIKQKLPNKEHPKRKKILQPLYFNLFPMMPTTKLW